MIVGETRECINATTLFFCLASRLGAGTTSTFPGCLLQWIVYHLVIAFQEWKKREGKASGDPTHNRFLCMSLNVNKWHNKNERPASRRVRKNQFPFAFDRVKKYFTVDIIHRYPASPVLVVCFEKEVPFYSLLTWTFTLNSVDPVRVLDATSISRRSAATGVFIGVDDKESSRPEVEVSTKAVEGSLVWTFVSNVVTCGFLSTRFFMSLRREFDNFTARASKLPVTFPSIVSTRISTKIVIDRWLAAKSDRHVGVIFHLIHKYFIHSLSRNTSHI